MASSMPSPIAVEELHNDIQRALVFTVNAILAEGLRGDDALDRIVEDIQPAVLFHPDVRSNALLFRKIRDIYFASRDSGRAVASILIMYKNDSAKYGETITENFQEAFDRYLRTIEDLQLPTTKGLQLLHYMLTGEALSF
jgi:hypothetical protein